MLPKLILLLKELDALCSTCNQCGMCQTSCPVFIETRHEADVARGKLALIDGLSREILSSPDKVLSRLNRCLLCGACSSGCSRNVKTLEIFIKARIIITDYSGLSFIKKIILKKIVANPLLFNKTVTFLKKYQTVLFKQNHDGKRLQSRMLTPVLKGRQLQKLPPESFQSLVVPKNKGAENKGSANVLFFAGCIINQAMPDVGLACIRALEYHNVTVSVLKEEGCCGMPSLSSGDSESFNKLVEYNTKLFSEKKFDFLITACATCTYAINQLWPVMYKGDFHSSVASTAGKAIDITQFITSHFLKNNHRVPEESDEDVEIVTIHDPCHLKKSLGISSELRRLVQANPNYRLQEMENPDSCCGFGGTFNLTNYGLSSTIGAKKCTDIENSTASIVATGCPACIIQLKDQLAKSSRDIEVKHVMELYADSLK